MYLCFDSDQAGKDGAAQAAAQLQKKGKPSTRRAAG
ncbi:MAG: hypothetical protein JKP90_16945 [Desulfofustis sp. PB-SRB1]|nr:hypothetical protein [Desulfofustis sp. PB-SRB1]